jgi:hypothetical protein
MGDTKYKGNTLIFWDLLKKNKIEIPIIQRDYAQGRKDKKEIRTNFLNALFESLEKNKEIKLDFIYGSIEDDVFQPLDGQQRLTTLFLLYWYAALKSGNLTDENINILQKFSYETRISSREFCRTLVSNSFTIEINTVLSTKIIDSNWFFLSWKKDPTISSMLRSIDDIHNLFFNTSNLWELLISEENLISFYHVELKNIGLTDDLYIKMNARGKLLSPFENFKASLQKKINDNHWDSDKNFIETFANKIDSIWTDVFWSHRKNNNIDEAFIRFISTILMTRLSLKKNDDRFNLISKLQEDSNFVRPQYFDEGDFNYLCNCFDIYYTLFQNNLDLKLNYTLFQHKPEQNIFSSIVFEGQNASYSQKVLFFAQTEYLKRNPTFDSIKFQNWMRVIRNLVSRGDVTKNGKRPAIIRSPQTFDGIIKLVDELAFGSGDIYKFLASDNIIKSTFTKEQIEEERLKAKLILDEPKNISVIHATEDNNLLLGRIDFALYCIDYDSSKDFDVEKLDKVQKVISEYLNNDSHLNNNLRRALLTISDENNAYEYYSYWLSFWYVGSANKRCLLDKYRELEFYIYGNKYSDNFKIYIKKLILKLIDKDLKEIVSDFNPPSNMPNWKIRLIKESALLDDNSKSNYIAIPDNEKYCYLLKSMRPRNIEGCEKIE